MTMVRFDRCDVRSRSVALVVATALATACMASTAAPASAGVYDCPTNRACSWVDGNYNGARLDVSGSISDLAKLKTSVPFNDRISSVSNRRATNVTWFAHAGYWGISWTLSPGHTADFSGGPYNDTMSSISL